MRTKSIGDKHKGKLIGAYVQPWLNIYLSLFSMARGINKSEVIEKVMEKWAKEQQVTNTEEELLKTIVNRINANWQVSKMITPEMTYKVYCETMRNDLEKKGLTLTQIDNIINKIKY